MFFIYGTDAPIYHYPIVTSVMIAVNVLVHFFVSITGYDVTPWILAFGDGLHPLQWLTHNFLHIGWMHLIGNMLFLFPFGLIVEGKIGWLRMLVLYLAIGTFQGFTQQVIMLRHDPIDDAQALVEMFNDPDNPMDEEEKEQLVKQWRKDLMKEGFGSLGASAVIFGLLAVCAIWAPVNEFDVYFRWSPLISAPDGGMREWSVLTVCGIFVVKEFFMFLMMGMPISSEALHLNGFVVGGAFGLATLYFGLVDCEGFDLISLLSGTKFVSQQTIAREQRERQEAIEAARPKGPPQAIVPKLAHQLGTSSLGQEVLTDHEIIGSPQGITASVGTDAAQDAGAGTSRSTSRKDADGRVLDPTNRLSELLSLDADVNRRQAMDSPHQPVSSGEAIGGGDQPALLFGDHLPSFDDGSQRADPQQLVRNEIESMVARGEFASAARRLAEYRKLHPDLVISAASMGRLAEGLLRGGHVKPATTVLILGCNAYPAYAARWRIRLAAIELTSNRDPIRAIKHLRSIDKDALDTKLRQQYVKVAEEAKRMASQRSE